MTTPTNFNTADRVIRMAYRDAGFLQEGEDPNSEMIADALNRLNDIINFEQTQGLKLWLQYDLSITPVVGQAAYVIKSGGDVNFTRPTRVLDSNYYLDSNGISRPIFLIAMDDYLKLSNRSAQGPVTQVAVKKNATDLTAYFWMVPDAEVATGSIHLYIQQQIGNIVTVTEAMQFPPEWFLWLRWALAADLASGQPEALMSRCSSFAEGYRMALDNWDVEDASTRFTANVTQYYPRSSFR